MLSFKDLLKVKFHLNITKTNMASSVLSLLPVLCSIIVLQMNIGSTSAINVWNMTDAKTYPACLSDQQCEKYDERKQNGKNTHACFQYFCYPWKMKSTTADKSPPLFKTCRKGKECKFDGKKGICFRHPNRRIVSHGICMKEMKTCDMHDECKDFGGKCCNGFCCNDKYFNEIKNIECISDDGCKDILAGDMCCIDISKAGDGWNTSNANWQKKCCMPSNGYAVIPPPSDVSDEKIPAINAQIMNMMGLAEVLCKAMDFELMIRFEPCLHFSTTTTATTTITHTTTTTNSMKTMTPTESEDSRRPERVSRGGAFLFVLSIIPFKLPFFLF